MSFKSVLIISDQHFPYSHPDIHKFLKAIDKQFKPDKVINVGDELDHHAISYHEKETELVGSNCEIENAIKLLRPIYELFPEMELMESNHGSLVYRKAKTAGLPKRVLKSYREVLEAPKGWRWVDDTVVKFAGGGKAYVCHGKSACILKLSQSMGMSAISGHFHERFRIDYWSSPEGLFWGMNVGCLIDKKSLAFAYNKLNLKRPIIGCGIVLNGTPRLLPMILDSMGRWIGEIR